MAVTQIGANNLSADFRPEFSKAIVPQSNNIKLGYALVHVATASGVVDNHAVDVPTSALAFLGGRAFCGIAESAGTCDVSSDGSVLATKLGIAKAALKIGAICTAGQEAGYDPLDGGPFQPVTGTTGGNLVSVGRFTQSRTASAAIQYVGIELHANACGGEQLLGAITAASATVTNTTTETAFGPTIPIPAGRIFSAGTQLKIRAKALATGGNASDTLTLRARLDSAAGTLLGATPAVNVTDAGGDQGFLDLNLTARTVGASGTFVTDGLGGISPGQAVATGGNVQTTGASGALDTTVAHTVLITAQWSAASSANIVQLESLSLSII